MEQSYIDKEIKKLEDKRIKYLEKRMYVQAFNVDAELVQLRQKLQYMIDQDKNKLHNIIANLPSEVKDEFEYCSLLLPVLSDLLDGLVTFMNDKLKTSTEYSKLTVTDKIAQLKSITFDLVKTYDLNSNYDTKVDYGEFSDKIKPLLIKKAQEHIAWIQEDNKKNKPKYAEN